MYLGCFARVVFGSPGGGSWGAVAVAAEDEAVGAVTQAVEGGGLEEAIGEGLAPFGEVEVGGNEADGNGFPSSNKRGTAN